MTVVIGLFVLAGKRIPFFFFRLGKIKKSRLKKTSASHYGFRFGENRNIKISPVKSETRLKLGFNRNIKNSRGKERAKIEKYGEAKENRRRGRQSRNGGEHDGDS